MGGFPFPWQIVPKDGCFSSPSPNFTLLSALACKHQQSLTSLTPTSDVGSRWHFQCPEFQCLEFRYLLNSYFPPSLFSVWSSFLDNVPSKVGPGIPRLETLKNVQISQSIAKQNFSLSQRKEERRSHFRVENKQPYLLRFRGLLMATPQNQGLPLQNYK